MNWIDGIQSALNYIEDNITEELDYNRIAEIAYSSPYHFQRVFSILCGYTLGEYIRSRRLSLAGAELAADKIKVIDAAVKYGYDSPDSFTKAFTKFHGITPSAARKPGAQLRSFARLSIKITLEGGNTMNYRIEGKAEMTITGVKETFTGVVSDRYDKQHDFFVKGETRFMRYALHGMAHDCDTEYSAVFNIGNEGYDLLVGNVLDEWLTEDLSRHIGEENAQKLAMLEIPAQKYLVVETTRSALSILGHLELRHQVISEYFSSSEYQLSNAPEITVYHAFENDKDSSYIELWLPIEKS